VEVAPNMDPPGVVADAGLANKLPPPTGADPNNPLETDDDPNIPPADGAGVPKAEAPKAGAGVGGAPKAGPGVVAPKAGAAGVPPKLTELPLAPAAAGAPKAEPATGAGELNVWTVLAPQEIVMVGCKLSLVALWNTLLVGDCDRFRGQQCLP
jgi:hypothetical protein